MAAVSIDGVVETMTCAVPPSYTALEYALFIHALAPSMGKWNPDLPTEEWEAQDSRSVLLIDNAAIHSDEADDLVRQFGILVLRLPPYSPDFSPVEGVFSVLKQWIAAESAQDRLAGVVMPNGERMGKYVGLIVDIGLASLTTAQCASQLERVYWEWLRQDAAYVGAGGGENDEGEEEGEHEQGEGEGSTVATVEWSVDSLVTIAAPKPRGSGWAKRQGGEPAVNAAKRQAKRHRGDQAAPRWPSGRPGAVLVAVPAAAKQHRGEGGPKESDGRAVTTGGWARAGAWDGNEAVRDAKQRLSVPEASVGHDESARALASACMCVRACNARTRPRQH